MNIKGPIVDINSRLNRIFLSFDPLNNEFSLRDRLINIFPSYFLFHSIDRKNKESSKVYIYKLYKLTLQILANLRIAVIVLDTSIKGQVATLIAHIYIYNYPCYSNY